MGLHACRSEDRSTHVGRSVSDRHSFAVPTDADRDDLNTWLCEGLLRKKRGLGREFGRVRPVREGELVTPYVLSLFEIGRRRNFGRWGCTRVDLRADRPTLIQRLQRSTRIEDDFPADWFAGWICWCQVELLDVGGIGNAESAIALWLKHRAFRIGVVN